MHVNFSNLLNSGKNNEKTIETKSNRKIVERCKIDTTNTNTADFIGLERSFK
jgi:hypothetical protein